MLQTHELVPHPAHPPTAVRRVSASFDDRGGPWILLRWRIEGAEEITVPPFAGKVRNDGLWQTTCGELFVAGERGEEYREFNFSPSENWAAYSFGRYREQAGDLALGRPPSIAWRGSGALALLDVWLAPDALPPRPLRLGMTLVLEERGGRKSYWAAAHPRDVPDFHDPACLAWRLAAPHGA